MTAGLLAIPPRAMFETSCSFDPPEQCHALNFLALPPLISNAEITTENLGQERASRIKCASRLGSGRLGQPGRRRASRRERRSGEAERRNAEPGGRQQVRPDRGPVLRMAGSADARPRLVVTGGERVDQQFTAG